MSKKYILKNTSSQASSPATTTPNKPATKTKGKPSLSTIDKVENLFLKKSVRSVAEVSNYLKESPELIARQIRRLKDRRGYYVSSFREKGKLYYEVR